MTLPLNTTAVRANFPAFKQADLQGWAFFENAGGAYMAQQVIDHYNHYFTAHKLQPYGTYPASQEAGSEMDRAHVRLAKVLNTSVDAIHIGPSTSANTYTLGKAFEEFLSAGDAIIVTNQCHEANTGAFRKLEKIGVEVREWQVNTETAELELDALTALLDDKVKLVTFPHCSNIVGHINPVKKICEIAHSVGAITVVDGVAYAPHTLPDITDLGADIYLFSTYKTYGPHQGVMVVDPDLAKKLPNQGHFFNKDILRKRLVPAGPDHAQIAACNGIVDYLDELAKIAGTQGTPDPYRATSLKMRAQETQLVEPLMDYLRGRNDVRIIGPSTPIDRVPTIAIHCEKPGQELAQDLAKHKIMAAGGHFYAYRLIKALDLGVDHGVLRMSFVHYTAQNEIDQLIKALDQVL
ncbi:aminotransferase class V-fold PLP-dependent enzyme [uncultured Maritalea sp.]|uniref:aminotransferase class V-fold PLP-dependent enzyme n=1 Tax=uncultured Maritalea sp. TaxID=757249 RepID=UPI002620C88E|nr:aminotransferase class V-fold PLP-dependent enzyme [uncultured Maritalea sp.]